MVARAALKKKKKKKRRMRKKKLILEAEWICLVEATMATIKQLHFNCSRVRGQIVGYHPGCLVPLLASESFCYLFNDACLPCNGPRYRQPLCLSVALSR